VNVATPPGPVVPVRIWPVFGPLSTLRLTVLPASPMPPLVTVAVSVAVAAGPPTSVWAVGVSAMSDVTVIPLLGDQDVG
jgi:hypothetical protein